MSNIKFDKLIEYIKENGESDEFSSSLTLEYLGTKYKLTVPNNEVVFYLNVYVPSLKKGRIIEKFNDIEYSSLAELLFGVKFDIQNELDSKLDNGTREQKIFDEFISNVKEVN